MAVYEVLNKNGELIVVDSLALTRINRIPNEIVRNHLHKDEVYVVCRCSRENNAKTIVNSLHITLRLTFGESYLDTLNFLYDMIFIPMMQIPKDEDLTEYDEEQAKKIVDELIKGFKKI